MKQSALPRILIVGLGLLLASGLSGAAKQPNVVFFALDDLSDWINPMGYSQAITPNMDRLAAAGVTFQNAHTAGSFCAPSRSAIFTGCHATTTGCYTTQVYFKDHPEITPLQLSFQQAGYVTFGAGKLFHHPAGFIDTRRNLKDTHINCWNLKDTHINCSKCLTDSRMVNKKTPKDANCSKNSRGCRPGGSVSLYFPLRAPCVSMWGR